MSISNDIVSTKIYDKLDDFDFEIVNFPFLDYLDCDVPRSTFIAHRRVGPQTRFILTDLYVDERVRT